MLGCPHHSIGQIWEVAQLLEGQKVHADCELWIFTPRVIKALADQNGCRRKSLKTFADIVAKAKVKVE